jgi:hypothetical protein
MLFTDNNMEDVDSLAGMASPPGASPISSLRRRKTPAVDQASSPPEETESNKEDVIWGKTPSGDGQLLPAPCLSLRC